MKQGLTGWHRAEYLVDEQEGGGQTGRVKDMVCLLDDIYMQGPLYTHWQGDFCRNAEMYLIYHLLILKSSFPPLAAHY